MFDVNVQKNPSGFKCLFCLIKSSKKFVKISDSGACSKIELGVKAGSCISLSGRNGYQGELGNVL